MESSGVGSEQLHELFLDVEGSDQLVHVPVGAEISRDAHGFVLVQFEGEVVLHTDKKVMPVFTTSPS